MKGPSRSASAGSAWRPSCGRWGSTTSADRRGDETARPAVEGPRAAPFPCGALLGHLGGEVLGVVAFLQLDRVALGLALAQVLGLLVPGHDLHLDAGGHLLDLVVA